MLKIYKISKKYWALKRSLLTRAREVQSYLQNRINQFTFLEEEKLQTKLALRKLCLQLRKEFKDFKITKDRNITTVGQYKWAEIKEIKNGQWKITNSKSMGIKIKNNSYTTIIHEIFHYIHHKHSREAFISSSNQFIELIAELATYNFLLPIKPNISYWSDYDDKFFGDIDKMLPDALDIMYQWKEKGYIKEVNTEIDCFKTLLNHKRYINDVDKVMKKWENERKKLIIYEKYINEHYIAYICVYIYTLIFKKG